MINLVSAAVICLGGYLLFYILYKMNHFREVNVLTNQEKKDFLEQYLDLSAEYKDMLEDYEQFKIDKERLKAATLSGMPKSNTIRDKMAANLANEECIELELIEMREKLIKRKIIIECAISRLKRARYRRIMRMRYITGMKWEHICYKANYSWTGVHKIHSLALTKISFEEV